VDILLEALALVRGRGKFLSATIVGDGPERAHLERQRDALGLAGQVEFTGGVAPQRVLDYLEQSDILTLVSETEGWPKAITEAMAFGLVCIGSNRGLVPQMLGDGRGIVIPPRDVEALADILFRIAEAPEDYDGMRAQAAEWAQQYSLEGLREALRSLHREHWGVALAPATAGAANS
jgi:glycosyltransferase involved in cell wall biosynthesis